MKNIPWGLVAILGVGLVLYAKRKELAQKFNPASDKNIAYQGANRLVRMLPAPPTRSGKPDDTRTIGTVLYDWLHPEQSK